ncbi:MAG: RNA polymerase sigma factor [Gemmatimonadota bacterium]
MQDDRTGLSSLTDDQLVQRSREGGQGDLGAFDELVHRYQERTAANCRYLTGSPDDALDLTQEVFVKAYFGLQRFEQRSQFSTWLQRIKVNHCLNFMKRRRRQRLEPLDDIPTGASEALHVAPQAERTLQLESERHTIRRVLDQMNDTLRVPLVMCDMDELSYQEIADELGIGLSAVKMRIKRGREEFRRRYEELHHVTAMAS